MIPKDVQAAGENAVIFYLYCVEENGCSPRLAEMFALRQFPKIMTDDVALGGMTTISDMYSEQPDLTDRLCKIAMARGYKPKPTDVYLTSVADSEGDPHAFMNHGQGRGHIQKVLESRGQSGDGMVKVQGRQLESDPYENPIYKLNPRIVKRIRERKIKENPDLARNTRDVDAQIIQDHGSE